MSFWKRLFGGSEPPRPNIETQCSFCGSVRRGSTRLIVGESASICPSCIDHCWSTATSAEGADPDAVIGTILSRILRELRSLARPAPRATTSALARAALVLARTARDQRTIASALCAADDPESALLALRAIPTDSLVPLDRVNEAVYVAHAGDPRTAVALLEAIDPASLPDAITRAVLRANRALLRFDAELADGIDAREAPHVASDLERVSADLTSLETIEAYARVAVLLRAHGARHLGNHERAATLLRERLVRSPKEPAVWALLERVSRERDDAEGAREARSNILEHAHPEGALFARYR